MTFLPVDQSGDLLPFATSADMMTDVEAVAQAVRFRLMLLLGEWWENETLGFEIPAFLFATTRYPEGTQKLESYIRQYIMRTEGVVGCDVSAEHAGRELRVRCNIRTVYGPGEVEVTNLELLRAVS